jgi:hypothetical protein
LNATILGLVLTEKHLGQSDATITCNKQQFLFMINQQDSSENSNRKLRQSFKTGRKHTEQAGNTGVSPETTKLAGIRQTTPEISITTTTRQRFNINSAAV